MTEHRSYPQIRTGCPTRRALLWSLLGVFALGGRAARAHSAPAFRILIHPDNPLSSVSQEFVTDVFLKRVTRWHDGEQAHPVDQRGDAEVRKSFAERVLRRSVSAVKRYWQQRIFSGRDLPPPELDDDDDVVGFVLKHRGAIGYVSGSAKLGRAKAVSLQ